MVNKTFHKLLSMELSHTLDLSLSGVEYIKSTTKFVATQFSQQFSQQLSLESSVSFCKPRFLLFITSPSTHK